MASAATSTTSPSSLHFPAPGSASPHSLPSIRLWPPNSSTRSTLVQRLASHLSSESFFSQRYGRIGAEEASHHAERIEQEAFVAASEHANSESADIAVVQFYAKEASRLMLECLKKGPASSSVGRVDGDVQQHGEEVARDGPSLETVFDISDGNREFLSEESATSLLKALTVPGNAYSSICFSNRSFGEDAAKVAGKILETLSSQLVKVNLADIVAGRNEEEALSVMSIFSNALTGCKLRYLNLSDNALGEKGVRAFSELLKSQHALEELYFINNGISEAAATAICELLPSSKKLKVLHFHNNMTGDEGAIALAELVKGATVLEDFRCSSTRVASEGGVALAEALLSGSSLKRLDVRDNPIGVEGGFALAKPLKQHSGLKEVYLSYLGFEDEGAEAVLEALEGGVPGLEVLEFSGNDITVSSVKKLASCIASKPKLLKLNLSENDLEDKGVVAICNAVQSGVEHLVELDLSETNIGRIGACAAAKAVALKPGFKLLGLNGNHISEAGIEALKEALEGGLHAADAAMANEDEEGIANDNVFESLMPNLFNRLHQCNDTVSEQEFQEIHRLLNLAGSDGDLMKENSSINQPLTPSSKQREKASDLAHEELKSKASPLIRFDYTGGKENALPTKLPPRNKLSRRERSSRVTMHRKPFVVDVRNFGSLLSNNALGKCKKPQDVLAFWEAADEREASEAIMRKLRGINEQKSGSKDMPLRRVGVRRKNSKRTTTRLKCFSVELPACADQVQSLDEEQLEEEEDAIESSSFTFLSNPEFRAQNQLFELSNAEKRTNALQLLSSVKSVDKDVINLDDEAEAESRCQHGDDNDILSDGKSPFENLKSTGQCSIGLADSAACRDGTDECEKQSQPPEISSDVPSHLAVEPMSNCAVDSQSKELEEDIDSANELEMEATPYNRNVAAKRTPFTSPTPPSNPLAEFGLRKDNVVEDVSKRRLDFEVDNTASTAFELDLSAPITQITPFLKKTSESPKDPKAQVEVTPPADVMLAHKENLEPAGEANRVKPDVVPTVATKSLEQNATKPLKKAVSKRKKLMKDQRHSLSGVGTKWKEGQRCSTRIRSRPLEWWRGERFLMGRVHKSLATVIGIKYSSPPPCWPKRGTIAPKFKVESYVSEEYAKYVRFAALC